MPRPPKHSPKPIAWLERLRTPATCLVLALLVLVVYGQMAQGMFSFYEGKQFQFIGLDDGDYITANPRVKQGLTWESINWAFTAYHSANWHPLTWLSLMLDVEMFGFEPAGYHVVNLCWHLANVLMLFAVLRRMSGQFWPSAVVAALFAVHPLHVESVAWVTERKDVLSTFFALLALLAYDAYARRPGWGRYSLVLGAYSLSLLCKQMWVTLPFALVLLDFWPLGRLRLGANEPNSPTCESTYPARTRWQLVGEKLPLLGLALASSATVFVVQLQAGAMSTLDLIEPGLRLQNVLASYWTYIEKTFWPRNLGILYPYPQDGYPLSQLIFSGVALVLITALAVVSWRKRPWLLVGWLWYLGTLVPVIGLVQVGSQAWADRYAYVPHIGLFVMIVWGVAGLVADLTRRGWGLVAKVGCSAATAVALVFLTIWGREQVYYWRDTEFIFAHTLDVTPPNYMICTNLAGYFATKDEVEKAKVRFREALQINPIGVDAMTQLGHCIATHVEDKSEAKKLFRRAMELEPNNAAPMVFMALLLTEEGKVDESIPLLKRAIQRKPNMLLAYAGLGLAYARIGDNEKAFESFNKGLEIDPYDFTINNAYADMLVGLKQIDRALPYYELVLRLSPEDAQTHIDYGTALAQLGRLADANAHFEEAVRVRPRHAEGRLKLGKALAAQGKSTQALLEFEEATKLRPDWAPPLNEVAWVQATAAAAANRNGARAVAFAEKACKITKREDPTMLDTLAAAYAEAGRWEEAVKTGQEAVEVAMKAGNKAMAEEILARVVLFQSRRPYRASAEQTLPPRAASRRQTPWVRSV